MDLERVRLDGGELNRITLALNALNSRYVAYDFTVANIHKPDMMGDEPSSGTVGMRRRLSLRVKTTALINHDRILNGREPD